MLFGGWSFVRRSVICGAMALALPKQQTPLARPVTTLLGIGPERAAQLGRLEIRMIEPGEETIIPVNRITPIYPLTEGLPQRWLRALIWRTLAQFENHVAEPRPEPGAPSLLIPPPFLSRAQAIRLLHAPEALDDVER